MKTIEIEKNLRNIINDNVNRFQYIYSDLKKQLCVNKYVMS